jgi:hypothetical protein
MTYRRSILRKLHGSMRSASTGSTGSTISEMGSTSPHDSVDEGKTEQVAAVSPPEMPRVGFGSIEIREHALVLGDHPDCSNGPPVQLGWECQHTTFQHLDDYEFSRRPRRHKGDLGLNYHKRKSILMNDQGLTEKEINAATKQVAKDKMRRDITKACMPFHIIGDAVGSSTQRLLKRAIKRDTGRRKY